MSEKLREKAMEVVSAIRSVNHSRHSAIIVNGDDEPCFWQRGEWIEWMLGLADELEAEARQSAGVAPGTGGNAQVILTEDE